jgi:hypothetical protein
MRYPNYEPEVNAILDVARAADLAHEACAEIPPTDIIQHLTEAGSKWSWSLIEIIMDYEQRERQRAAADHSTARERHALAMVPRVTRQHGEKFAEECTKLTDEDVTVSDVFGETEIIEWPDDDAALQERFQELRREIVREAFAAVRPALAEAFVRVANEVIERERAPR